MRTGSRVIFREDTDLLDPSVAVTLPNRPGAPDADMVRIRWERTGREDWEYAEDLMVYASSPAVRVDDEPRQEN